MPIIPLLIIGGFTFTMWLLHLKQKPAALPSPKPAMHVGTQTLASEKTLAPRSHARVERTFASPPAIKVSDEHEVPSVVTAGLESAVGSELEAPHAVQIQTSIIASARPTSPQEYARHFWAECVQGQMTSVEFDSLPEPTQRRLEQTARLLPAHIRADVGFGDLATGRMMPTALDVVQQLDSQVSKMEVAADSAQSVPAAVGHQG